MTTELSFHMSKFLITGATGSLGRRLTLKLLSEGHTVIAYSRDEAKHAKHFFGVKNVVSVIGDVRDYQKLNMTMSIHKPDFVIHTAALKRVDDLEIYPDECIKTNITGTQNVALASLIHEVKKCVLISTDKACCPINVYGSSKFICERIFSNFNHQSSSCVFSSVRYGNVIASRGSFIPLWIDSINKGSESVTITDEKCSRFLFTIQDAVDTVLSSLNLSKGGEVFIPKISSYKILDVLKAVKKITGKECSYTVSGLRPGEKVHEDMLSANELPYSVKTSDENIIAILPQYGSVDYEHSGPYDGIEFNSSMHLDRDVDSLVSLIRRGLSE